MVKKMKVGTAKTGEEQLEKEEQEENQESIFRRASIYDAKNNIDDILIDGQQQQNFNNFKPETAI